MFSKGSFPLKRLYLLFFLVFITAQASDPLLISRVEAAYIYHLTQFAEWPQNGGDKTNGPLRIGVLGQGSTAELLQQLPEKTTKGRPLRVQQFKANDPALIQCHILYISPSENEKIPSILREVQGGKVLSVSSAPNFTRLGGIIEFVILEGKLKMQINVPAAKRAGLKLSAKLLEVAILKEEEQE